MISQTITIPLKNSEMSNNGAKFSRSSAKKMVDKSARVGFGGMSYFRSPVGSHSSLCDCFLFSSVATEFTCPAVFKRGLRSQRLKSEIECRHG